MNACPICDNEFEDTFGVCSRHDSAQPKVEAEDALIGSIFQKRYRLQEVIGRGATGVVYGGMRIADEKEVAIKVLQNHLASDPESVKRFQYEAQAASSLRHPHIVRLYDVGMAPGGQPYIVMERLPGQTLSAYMKGRQHLEPHEALPILKQVCEALAEAHSHGVLHRDIKPANIMLMERFGQENFVVVLDFSIAKIIQRVSDVRSTTAGLIFGSPAYMSPERFKGSGTDFRSDVYSMGVIMFQILAGRAPFKSANLQTLMNQHINDPPPRVKDIRPEAEVSPELEATIAKALAKQPGDRQQNIRQLLAEIDVAYRARPPAKQQLVPADESFEESSAHPSKGSQVHGENGSQSHQSRSPSDVSKSTFEIDPGISAHHESGRRFPDEQSSGNNQKLPAELIKGNSWSTGRNASDRQRPVIRPTERNDKLPIELAALVTVTLFGAWAVIGAQSPSEAFPKAIQSKIAEGQLDEANALMKSWYLSLEPTDQENYWLMADALGKAYYERRRYADAGRWFDLVPDKSKASSVARKYLQKLRKTFP